MRRSIVVVLLGMGLVACGGGSGTGGDVRGATDTRAPGDVAAGDARADLAADGAFADGGPETTAPDAARDVSVADTVASACVAQLLREHTFAVLPGGPDTQIHAAVAFDGTGVWLTCNIPNPAGTGDFDVWAARFACSGGLLVAPFAVATADHGNEIDPDIAIGDGHVYVVWQADTGGNPNLFVYYRTFDLDGTPLMPVEQPLVLRRGGAAVSASVWMAHVAALPTGFVVAAAWADPAAQGFQAVLQRLRADGTPAESAPGVPEELIAAFAEPAVSQEDPAVTAQDDGTVWLAWTRSDADGNETAQHTALPAGASATTPSPPALASAGASGGVSYATLAAAGSPVYLAYFSEGAESDVFVRNGAVFDPQTPALGFGTAGRLDHTPTLAVAPGGGAVAWFRTRSGIQCDVLAQRFTDVGGTLAAAGDARLLNPPEAGNDHAAPAVYPPAITYVGDNVWFVVWSEGRSPAFRLQGRFVAL